MNPIAINTLFILVSAQFNLPSGLLSSVCFIESHHNPTAIHYHDGKGSSIGLCQIKLKTAQSLGFKGTEKQLMQVKNNIYYAGAYLHHQQIRYNGDITKAVIAYNIGHSGNLTTSRYQVRVFNKWSGGRHLCDK
jgi:soluble lytic murein transglycosylase-like protein